MPLVWTRCHLGGARPWFRCNASVGGRACGRRVAKLYLRGHVFACRQCYGLAYASQSETRGIARSAKVKSSECDSAACRASSTPLRRSRRGCIGRPTIGGFTRRWPRRSARSGWSANIWVATIPVFEARRTSRWVDFRHYLMQRAGRWGGGCSWPRMVAADLHRRRRWGPPWGWAFSRAAGWVPASPQGGARG